MDGVSENGRGLSAMTEAELSLQIGRVRSKLRGIESREESIARAFALVREISARQLGRRHYDVQIRGAKHLLAGRMIEMETGEGKSMTAALAAAVAAMAGEPVHIVTVNDYLAERDARELAPLYSALGLSVGHVVSGLEPADRRAAYHADVTYCSNKELVFDYLRDRISTSGCNRLTLAVQAIESSSSPLNLLQRGLRFAIVDEADSVLIDEARTPLIISEAAPLETVGERHFRAAIQMARGLSLHEDYLLDSSRRQALLTEGGRRRLAQRLSNRDHVLSVERTRSSLVELALAALHLFQQGQDYLVRGEKIEIIDSHTGRIMEGRSWQRGLHQMIETKEGIRVTAPRETRERLSYQRFFLRYERLAGMTGTAEEVADEIWNTYRLPTIKIPPNRPCIRQLRRERTFLLSDEKWNAVVSAVAELHAGGRPILIGTTTVEESEELSRRLGRRGIFHRVLSARQDHDEASVIAEAGAAGQVTVATNMAGRGTDIRLAKGVAEIGGLHVIATARHESRRIDRQLQGRCARQGEPGSTEGFYALDDGLAMRFAPRWQRAIAAWPVWNRLGVHDLMGSAFWSLWQRRAAARHAKMRLELMKSERQRDRSLAFTGTSS